MQQLMQEEQSDSAQASYIEALKIQRDRWEQECVEAQAEVRRLRRNNRILQLRIEQLEAETESAEQPPPPSPDVALAADKKRKH